MEGGGRSKERTEGGARRGQRVEQRRGAGYLIHQRWVPIHHPGTCIFVPLFFVHFGCTWGRGVHRLDLKRFLLFLCSNEHHNSSTIAMDSHWDACAAQGYYVDGVSSTPDI
jgi:hypothetical protein